MISLPERLKKVRSEATQQAFAGQIGVNVNTLRAYEKGRSLPSADVLKRICLNFDVSTQWLLLGEGPMKRGEAVEQSQEGLAAASPPVRGELEELREECRELRQENRELNKENRQLLKENGDLRVELAKAEVSDKQPQRKAS